ncbi:MAG TPA: hydroxymethylbilane synthase [Verrucomicrobiota bacterium]|nr:hydroxymethylbilane synthase [Verrucomicrobiales bacterium]HRI15089.1 hydroxymethylbilane synthase [Verrucomicrobiota bacterium]
MSPSSPTSRIIRLATRGSALALAQAEKVRGEFARAFPSRTFELMVVKTTGDQLPTLSLVNPDASLPRGLFTKELEVALLAGEAEIAVHSLKDLPTDLPEGLLLAATPPREDVREVLLYRAATVPETHPHHHDWRPGQREPLFGEPGLILAQLPQGAVVATSSTRRAAAVKIVRPDVVVVPIRGNVGTRLRKLRDSCDFDVTILAAAGLLRLHFDIGPRGELRIDPRLPASSRAEVTPPPSGLLATLLEPEQLLPAVGQGALGLEVRADDDDARTLCLALNHTNTFAAVSAERALLSALGGGCQTPVAAYARVLGHQLRMEAVRYFDGQAIVAQGTRPVREALELGREVGARLVEGLLKN